MHIDHAKGAGKFHAFFKLTLFLAINQWLSKMIYYLETYVICRYRLLEKAKYLKFLIGDSLELVYIVKPKLLILCSILRTVVLLLINFACVVDMLSTENCVLYKICFPLFCGVAVSGLKFKLFPYGILCMYDM